MSRRVCVRFLSGRLEGGVVPLPVGRPLLLGRQPGADLLLAEELASRRHARVTFDGQEVVVEDLGSTNGTFVNGARVTRSKVAEGDRVLVGETIFTVIVRAPPSAAAATQFRLLVKRTPDEGPRSAIQGRLDEVLLADVLQLIGAAHKSGVLAIRAPDADALVTIDRGVVVACSIPGRSLPARKALLRVFEWRSGQFEFEPGSPGTAPPGAAQDSMDAIVMDAARHLDELPRLRASLPRRFTVADDVALAALDPTERQLVELAATLGDVDAVLDATPLPDLAAAERLAALHERGVLVAAALPVAS